MKVLDTDTLRLVLQGQTKVTERRRVETAEIVMTVVTRIEIFQGRFATRLRVPDGEALQRGQDRLDQAVRDLQPFAVLPINAAVADEFDRLRLVKGLKKIGRAARLGR